MPNAPRADNPVRSLRINPDIWAAAKAKAAERNETISAVVRRALERYVK